MKETVIVLDSDRQFLGYTHPAIARRLIRQGKASVYANVPFAISLDSSSSKQIRSGLVSFSKLVF